MILKRIRLMNFRQFYGDQTLEIAPPGKQNVTLIHAENGVGKTTLLNSVLWALFEDTTKRFEQRDQIVNFTARREGRDTARVEVHFDHEAKTYVASRDLRITPGGYIRTDFNVRRYDHNGALSPPLPNPEVFVNSVIPRSMAPYFFFDGEQAETFASETNYKAVGAAIRDILGCSLLEHASGDLDYLARQFEKDLGALQDVDQLSEVEKRIDEHNASLEAHQNALKATEKELDSLEAMISQANAKLRDAEAASQLQSQREELEDRLGGLEEEIKLTEGEIVQWIGGKGLALASSRLSTEAASFIESESLHGRIPSPYNEEFVKNLLQAAKCVCDRPIQPASDEWRAIQRLLIGAASAEAMNRVVRARSRLASFADARDEAPRLLQTHHRRQAHQFEERRKLEQSLEGIAKKLGDSPEPDVQRREAARKELLKRRDQTRDARTRSQLEIERLETEIHRLRGEVDELASKNQKAMKLVTRREAARQAAEMVRSLLKNYEGQAKAEVQEAVNKVLDKVARRYYRLSIGDDFELLLLYMDGTPAPKSGGENQLMSLAFIAALVDFARRRSEQLSNRFFIPATVAPLILDSPFGQLDDNYRGATAKFVPEMAPQVVLLVSSSQGKSEVISSLEGSIGKEYVLIAENTGPRADKPQDFISLYGKRMATTLFNCDRDLTLIKEVSS